MLQPQFATDNRPLASLKQTGLEKLFHSWLGASGRRYICSVYDLGEPAAFDRSRAVAVAVRRNETGAAIPLFVFQSEKGSDFGTWTRRARAAGAQEWHVHLLAETAEARALVVRDLSPVRRLFA